MLSHNRISRVIVPVLSWLAVMSCVALELSAAESKSAEDLFAINARSKVEQPRGSVDYRTKETLTRWDAKKTALIICDMWNQHWCKGATARVVEIAPRMNELVKVARSKGATIIHAPSGCMKHYQDHPARKVAQSVPRSKNLPAQIGKWCPRISAESKGKYPIDQSDGGCDCEPKCKTGGPWRSQIDTIKIDPKDAISDSGEEIWSLMEERGIDNVMIMGVHTNMCVLGRPFGLRNMSRYGKNTVLVRDMTDTMYNSRSWPYVSHFRGTDLIVAHIEKFVCPTITSKDILGGDEFRFKDNKPVKVVFAIAENLYGTAETLPVFARDALQELQGFEVTVLQADAQNKNSIPRLGEKLETADLLFLSVRRRALPEKDLQALRTYLDGGKPLVAIRTTSHAFDTRGKRPQGHAEWREFDPEVLGGHYAGHHRGGKAVTISTVPGAEEHPICRSIKTPFSSVGSLYKTSPLADSAVPLLMGSLPGEKPEPVAWTHSYKQARVFYTSLGYSQDFEDPQFVQLLTHGILWALNRPLPPRAR